MAAERMAKVGDTLSTLNLEPERVVVHEVAHLRRGDLIVRLNQHDIGNATDLKTQLALMRVGDQISFAVEGFERIGVRLEMPEDGPVITVLGPSPERSHGFEVGEVTHRIPGVDEIGREL